VADHRTDRDARVLARGRRTGRVDGDRAGYPSSSLRRGGGDDGGSCSRRRGCRRTRAWGVWAAVNGDAGGVVVGSLKMQEGREAAVVRDVILYGAGVHLKRGGLVVPGSTGRRYLTFSFVVVVAPPRTAWAVVVIWWRVVCAAVVV